ncbi:MAG TPA: hypothetical protein ENN44_06040 [Methanoculleus sp.]|nr:hypothetical protein [Methanoculleus sp.]
MFPNPARDGPPPRFDCGIAALALLLLVGGALAGIYFLNESGAFAPGVYQETFYLRYDAPSLPNMFLANYGYEDGNHLHFIGNFQAYVLLSLLLLLLYLAIGPLLGIPGPFSRCFFFWSLVTMMTGGALLITGFSLWVHSGDAAYGVGFSGINHELMGFFVFTLLIGAEYMVGRRRWSRRHPLFFTWVAMIAGMTIFLAWVEFSIRMDIADIGGINAAHLAGSILGFTLPSVVFLVQAWKGSTRDTGGGPVREESQEKNNAF